MWVKIGDRLIQTSDKSRVKFRTTFSKQLLENLRELADEHTTYANYLLETGMEKTLEDNTFIKETYVRPNDRIQYKTTFDEELLKRVRQFAKDKKASINDILEYSVRNIDVNEVKRSAYRYRVEE